MTTQSNTLTRADLFYLGQIMSSLISYWPTMTWMWHPPDRLGPHITAQWAEDTANHAAHPGDRLTVVFRKSGEDVIVQFGVEVAELKTLGPDEGTLHFDQDGRFIDGDAAGGEVLKWLAEITPDDGDLVYAAAQRIRGAVWCNATWCLPAQQEPIKP